MTRNIQIQNNFIPSHKYCGHMFIRYILTSIILLILLGLGIAFGKYIFLRYLDFNEFFTSPNDPLSIVGVIGLFMFTGTEIIFVGKRHKHDSWSWQGVIITFSFLFIIIFSAPILAGFSAFIKIFFDFKINMSLYGIIYLPPIAQVALTAIVYILFSIKDKYIKLYKINIISSVVSFIVLGVCILINLLYMSSTGGIFDSSYIGRIIMMITPIITFIVMMLVNGGRSGKYKSKHYITDAFGMSAVIYGIISSVIGIILLIIPLIIGLIMISAGDSKITPPPVYKDQYGDEYTKSGLEYTKTKDGSKGVDGNNVGQIVEKH